MANLTLDAVTKTFAEGDGEIVAVDDVSIEIDDGEFVVLVGPSGCGKSTTLRMVAGLETATSGEISLGGQRINETPAQDRDIAMVFQSYALYPHMTVRENMAFGLQESTDMAADAINERVERTADMLSIPELLDRKPTELSGGQQQRVALGRAIVRDPEVFLLDEPLSNLDAKLRAEMRTELQTLQEDLDVTTLYVTHDQTEAMTMGDRIAILDGGELQQIGTPLECYHKPTNRFVAGFIGEPSMNFFSVTQEDDSLVGDGFDYPLSPHIRDAISDTDALTLGIRPEDIELTTASGAAHEFDAVVDVVEPRGDENTVHLQFANATDGDRFTATVGGMVDVVADGDVVVKLPETAIHLFDASTGQALHNREFETVETPDEQLV
ncbi:MAG: ABC transporter ATP-binding protein [Halobacteriales archaeon]